MKKVFLSALLMVATISIIAQEKGKLRVGLDMGLGLPRMGAGITGDLDIRFNILDNLNLGVKFGSAFMLKEVDVESENDFSGIMNLTAFSMIHGDYYFNEGISIVAPFIGGGFGKFNTFNWYADNTNSGNYSYTNIPFDKKTGGMVRGGFELGHFRLALEWYIIPRSTLNDVHLQNIGTCRNSFANLTLGFYLGGGRWRK